MKVKIQKLESWAPSVNIQSSILKGISVFVNGYTGMHTESDSITFGFFGFYARQHICYSAYMPRQFRLSVRPSVRPTFCLSVCPSVCLSHACFDQITGSIKSKMAADSHLGMTALSLVTLASAWLSCVLYCRGWQILPVLAYGPNLARELHRSGPQRLVNFSIISSLCSPTKCTER